VFIASIVGVESVRAPLAYSAAKTALHAYAKNLARAVASQGVRVNVVAPGNVLFDGGSWAAKLAEDPERVRGYIGAEVPLGRFGNPEEIADLVAFLASSRAAFITGACVVADGGQTRTY
jgi:3-oxoacyl-[acyl-carrier protein] reductase